MLCSVSQSNSPWDSPAPWLRTTNFLRCVPGIWTIASVSTSMWSEVVFDAAFPARSFAAKNSRPG
jgi:hypothetical protein